MEPENAAPAPVDTKAASEKMYGEEYSETYPLYGITSFTDLEEMEAAAEVGQHAEHLTRQFQMMVGNIMRNGEVVDKTSAIEILVKEFTLRLNRPLPKSKSLAEKILSVFRRNVAEPDPAPAPDEPAPDATKTFTIWKTKEGGYRWLAIYSNNFRDRDNPPEIISEKSHLAFLDLVDKGIAEYPELWHWHIPGTAWGKADWLDYADGFALASGYIYAGHEKEAEAAANCPDDIRVSHGMPSRVLLRDEVDPSIINFHVTVEISDLPADAAANALTDFVVLNKESPQMALSTDKRDYLQKMGLSPEQITGLEASLATNAKAARDAGIQSKEQSPAEAEAATPAPAADATSYVTTSDFVQVLQDTIKPLIDSVNGLVAANTALQTEVKALKESDSTKIAQAALGTPKASLSELVAASLFGQPDAVVDGRSKAAKVGPRETQAAEVETLTPFGYIDQMIARSRSAEVTQ